MEPVLIAIADGVAEITLNRPDKLNSFNEAMHIALRLALDQANRDEDVRAILLTGAGRGFCAGQDLGDRTFDDGSEPDLGATLDGHYNPLSRLIRSLNKPIVCAVNGVAAGAGANLAFACDIVLAARSARFIQAFAKIGLIPDNGGSYYLPRLIGPARAMALALTAQPVPADQAESWGLIWRAVDDAALLDEARKLTAGLAAGPTRGLALIRKTLHASLENDFDTQLDLERDTQRQAGRTADYREGVQAFLEKRAPRFSGR